MTDRIEELTERLMIDAGLGPGMRVLDVGCGHGLVSFAVARLVGETGQVVGVDREARPLAAARLRTQELGLRNVTFVEGDLADLQGLAALATPAAPGGAAEAEARPGFDAIVGRRVLMYVSEVAAVVRALAGLLRPGGVAVFQEADGTMVPASPAALPLQRQVHRWMWQTLEREGACLSMGFELPAVLAQAGLVVEGVRAEAAVQTPGIHHGGARIVRAMLPRIVRHGVATEAEIDVDTLDARLIEERRLANATYVGDMAFGVWARKPA
jgi:SAM-dependent methyltransferase